MILLNLESLYESLYDALNQVGILINSGCFALGLQYSSQIVETGAICLEFSQNFLHSLLTPSFSLKFATLLPQC